MNEHQIEIDREAFDMVARAITMEIMMIATEARAQGWRPSPWEMTLQLPDFFGILWVVTRPDCRGYKFDLSDKVDNLPDAEVYGGDCRYWVFIDGDGDPICSFVEGHKRIERPGWHTSEAFNEGLQPILMDLLIDGCGVEPAKARKVFDSDKSFSHKVKTLLDQSLEARIEAEVTSFRDEINTKLDTLFGGGDST